MPGTTGNFLSLTEEEWEYVQTCTESNIQDVCSGHYQASIDIVARYEGKMNTLAIYRGSGCGESISGANESIHGYQTEE